jgi:hypothetical protein
MKASHDRKPVSDPHIMCMGLGDATCDEAPLQVTQFEASVAPLVEQVSKIWLEGNGGGNGGESYPLAWMFTAAKTKCDAIKKGRKGFLFTIGDEAPLTVITRAQAKKFADLDIQADMDARVLHDHLAKDWHIFHLITETPATQAQDAITKWRDIMGERAIVVQDIDKLAEVIVSLMQVLAGSKSEDIIQSWDARTQVVVRGVVEQMGRLVA